MPADELDIKGVDHITIDALGLPGKRTFYIQGTRKFQVVTLILEKTQVQALALGVQEFINEVEKRFPELTKAESKYVEESMHITPPVDPLFRVGELHLGYQTDNDFAIIILREIVLEGMTPSDAKTVRFWCTRSQLLTMSLWGLEVSTRGRASCPYCNEPLNKGEKHICVKKNGKKL